MLNYVMNLPIIGRTDVPPSCGIAGFIDVETTGLDCRRDEIVEIAVVTFAYHRVTGEISGVVDEYVGQRCPMSPISRAAQSVNHLTSAALLGHFIDEQRVLAMISTADFLIAHNASFDRAFVVRLLPSTASKKWLCSMEGIGWRLYGFPSRKLQYLLDVHKIVVPQRHRAGADARAAVLLLSVRPAWALSVG